MENISEELKKYYQLKKILSNYNKLSANIEIKNIALYQGSAGCHNELLSFICKKSLEVLKPLILQQIRDKMNDILEEELDNVKKVIDNG